MDAAPSPHLTDALASFAAAIEGGTLIDQLRAAREVDRVAPPAQDDADLSARHRALLHEARAHLSANEMRFAEAREQSTQAAEAWRADDDHANELVMRMSALSAEISALSGDAIAIAPLTEKQEHLLTALRAADPSPRRLLDGILTAGYAALRVQRFDQAREHFREAQSRAQDDAERARVLGAAALCELEAGHDDAARAKAAESIRLSRSSGDRMQLATMLRFVTGIQGAQPDELSSALAAAHETVELAAELGDVFSASSLRLRGLLRIAAGDGAHGADDLEESIRTLRGSAWQRTLPSEVLALGQVLVSQGEHARAARVVREYDDLLTATTGDEQIEAHLLRYQVSVHSGDVSTAAAHAETAAELMSSAHHKAASNVWEVAAAAWRAAGDPDRAQRAADRAAAQH